MNKIDKQKTQEAKISKKGGFTLIEVIVAMFIFSLMMVAISGVFVSFIKANRHARAIQQDLEDAEYAMNIMSKTLRTSSIITMGADKNSIEIYDYSQGLCIGYLFDVNSGNLMTKNIAPATPDDPSTCNNDLVGATYQNLTNSGNVLVSESGFVRKTETTKSPNAVGSVTILITIQETGATDKARVQTSVSLHDYSEVSP